MAWTLNPADPVFTYREYEIALHLFQDDMGDNIVMCYRAIGASTWQSMGAADGQVWGPSDYSSEVKMKGFQIWLKLVLALMNSRFAAWVQANFGTAPAGDPATFAEFQLWARDRLKLVGDEITHV